MWGVIFFSSSRSNNMTSRNSGTNSLRADIPESRRGNLVPISLVRTQRGRYGPSTGNCLHWQGFLTLREQCDCWAPDTNHLCESPWGVCVSGGTVPLRKGDTHQQPTGQPPQSTEAQKLEDKLKVILKIPWFSRDPDPLRKTCF